MNRSKIHQNNSFMPLDLFYIFFLLITNTLNLSFSSFLNKTIASVFCLYHKKCNLKKSCWTLWSCNGPLQCFPPVHTMSSWLKIVASWGPCGGDGVSVAAAAQQCVPKLSITHIFLQLGGSLNQSTSRKTEFDDSVKYEVTGILVKQPPAVFYF